VFATMDDVAGKVAETEGELSTEVQKSAQGDEEPTENEEGPAEFAEKVHPGILPEIAKKPFPSKTIVNPYIIVLTSGYVFDKDNTLQFPNHVSAWLRGELTPFAALASAAGRYRLMALQSLLTLQIAFLLAGTSAPGPPEVLGVVVLADRARLNNAAVSEGATVYDGDNFSTEEGGALRLRCNAAMLELAEKSVALVHHAGGGSQGLQAQAELLQGTLVFSVAQAAELEIEARAAHIRPAANGRTAALVSVIGPKELHIYARRGAVLFSYRGESATITEGESFEVILDPSEDGSGKKQTTPPAHRRSKAFLLIAAGAAAAAVLVYKNHEHKDMESPDRP